MFADTPEQWQLNRPPLPHFKDPKQFLEQTRSLCALLSPETKSILKKLENGEYKHYQFTDIPITERIPPTPLAYPPPEESNVSQATGIVGCIGQTLGKIFGYQENSDYLIYDIYPVCGYEQSSSFINSRKMLGFHSDGSAHTQLAPDYTLLFCIRNDLLSVNLIAYVDDVIKILPDKIIKILFEPRFIHLVSQTPQKTVCKAILNYEQGNVTIKYDEENVSGTDKQSREAIDILNLAIRQSAKPVKNYANSLLILNNKRCLHARTPFEPRYNGKDRWIKGTYVSRDPIENGTILKLNPQSSSTY